MSFYRMPRPTHLTPIYVHGPKACDFCGGPDPAIRILRADVAAHPRLYMQIITPYIPPALRTPEALMVLFTVARGDVAVHAESHEAWVDTTDWIVCDRCYVAWETGLTAYSSSSSSGGTNSGT